MRVAQTPRLAYLCVALCLVACRKSTDAHDLPSASASKAEPAPPAPLAERDVSGEAAFDIVTAADGAAIAWGRPAKHGSQVAIAFTDGSGAPRGEPVTIEATSAPAQASVVEIALATVGAKLGVAWVDKTSAGASVWGAIGDPLTRSFAPGSEIMDSALGDASQRGHVALAASESGELMVLARGPDEPCKLERGRTCTTFGFRQLSPTGPERRGLPMAVPAACSRPLVGFALIRDRWQYAVCSEEDGRPTVTAFNVQRTPYYAEAKRLLPGCTPLGTTILGDEVLVAGDCADGRRAVRLGGMNDPVTTIELEKSQLVCERGRPVLKALGAPPLVLVLDTPKDGLAPLLPASLAPRNARAVWTGTTLLVATWMQQKLVLRRYGCLDGELRRL